jgi:hypothetical protein
MKSSKYLALFKPAFIDIDDVNKALTEMHCDVAAKLGKDEFTVSLTDQNVTNEILCAENCVARWLWRSG